MKARWPALLAAQIALTGVVYLCFLLGVSGEGAFPRVLGDSETWLFALALFAGVSVVQAILLAPVARRRARRARGAPVWMSLVLGALLFALLAGTMVMSIGHALLDGRGMSTSTFYGGVTVAAAAWIGGTIYFASFMRARPDATRESLIQLLATRLLQATVFEAIAIIPLDAMIRRKSDCYCAAASLFAFSIAMAVGLVVFGPAVFLSLLSRRRERWYRERCDACGNARGEVMAESRYREQAVAVCATCGHASATRDA